MDEFLKKINKFLDLYFSGKWLMHPIVVAVVAFIIGYYYEKC